MPFFPNNLTCFYPTTSSQSPILETHPTTLRCSKSFPIRSVSRMLRSMRTECRQCRHTLQMVEAVQDLPSSLTACLIVARLTIVIRRARFGSCFPSKPCFNGVWYRQQSRQMGTKANDFRFMLFYWGKTNLIQPAAGGDTITIFCCRKTLVYQHRP